MEIKKTPKADLENKKSTWLLVGYVIVLAFMFIAFEWTKRDIKIDTSQAITDLVFEEEIIPITEQPEQVAPPPPEAPSIAETLTIVDDDADVEETTIATSEETNQAVEIKYVPVAVEEEEPEEQTIFEVVEQMPEFPNGGMAGLMQYLSKNIKYPTIAQENGTQGRVTVQFVVNRDGSIVDAKVLRGVDPYLDKEAIRVISSMPKWKPGMQRGKAVRVKYTVPVMFRTHKQRNYNETQRAPTRARFFSFSTTPKLKYLCLQLPSFSKKLILILRICDLFAARRACMILSPMFCQWVGKEFVPY